MHKKIRLGLFGFGCVGQGLHQIWRDTAPNDIDIKKIVIKSTLKERSIDSHYFTSDPDEVLEDPEINVIVEVIDDNAFSFHLLKESLRRGKIYVTASKKMLAENLKEICELQKKYNTPVLYEGAVCGSIPILRNLENYYRHENLKNISGIFNGSTNYILTNIFQNGISYDDALGQAQALGFAETDPSLDVQGYDSKFKLAILVAHAFGVFVHPDQIRNVGIDKIKDHDIKYARDHGMTIKLIAKAVRVGDKILGLVAPQFVRSSSLLSKISNENNAVSVDGPFAGNQLLIGKGAGSLPTGLAIWSDINALIHGYKYGYEKVNQHESLNYTNDGLVNVRVSFHAAGIEIGDFEQFLGGYKSKDVHFMSGWVTLDKLDQWRLDDRLSIILEEGESFKLNIAKSYIKQCLA